MEKFYHRYENSSKLKFSLEEILPSENTKPSFKERAVYISYVNKITGNKFDSKLYPFRQKSLLGSLKSKDFHEMNELLNHAKSRTKYDAYLIPIDKESSKFYAYAEVKTCAMLMAQILFTNHAMSEGLLERIEDITITEILTKLSQYIRNCSEKNKSPINEDDSNFYATLFLLQTAFDKLFVPDEDIVTYDITTGNYQVSNSYHKYTSYLELSNKKVITASKQEKDLCYNITTGWSQGIDILTWDKLNEYYYGAKSPTTGEENLFTKNYDVILEKMLPQFGLARVRLSETVLKEKKDRNLKIVEIGAGSGAFAIDLIMSCKRLKIPLDEIEYQGIDPSEYMRDNFKNNIEHKIDHTHLPENWCLVEGSLEKVCAIPENYFHENEFTVIVISYCIHHCYPGSVIDFFSNKMIRDRVKTVFVLDGVKEHGWTKPYYMWADCESPENFDNVEVNGIWHSDTIWTEPNKPIEGHCLTNAWCSLRKLT